MNQHHESVSLTAGVFLIDEEIVDQLWSVRNQILKVPEQMKLLNNLQTNSMHTLWDACENAFMSIWHL